MGISFGAIEGDTRSLDYSSYGIYLGLKVGIWEPLWARSIYHIPTWTLWACWGQPHISGSTADVYGVRPCSSGAAAFPGAPYL